MSPGPEVSAQRLEDLARQLGDAWATASTVPPPATLEPSLTVEDAYSIQEMIVARRLDGSRQRAGWKLGLTSAPPPAIPIVGSILSDMVAPTGSRLALSSMVAPMVEAELVVYIGETIDGARSLEDLASGPHEVGPGLEVIDYRTVGESGVIDWIADNSTVAHAVVADRTPLSEVEPASVEVSLYLEDHELASGSGSQVMGSPLAAVAWLSGHLAERGLSLSQGDIVLTGSLTGHHVVPADSASLFRADFAGLGPVEIGFRP